MADAPQIDPVAGLVDIPLPAAVSLWPQTWPSRIAVAVIAAGVIGLAVWLVRRWHRNRYRRAALGELKRMEEALAAASPSDVAAYLATLVRRTALAAFPREQVARLTGAAWLSFLDLTGGGRDFSDGPGRSLEVAAYELAPAEPRALVKVVRHWIRTHHA